jgi:hypothetical protein
MTAFIGLPEPDGALPFALLFKGAAHQFLLVGTAGGAKGCDQLDLLAFTPGEGQQHLARLREDFNELDIPTALTLILRALALSGDPLPEEVESMLALLPAPGSPMKLPQPDLAIAARVLPLMDPKSGAFYGIDEDLLRQGLSGIAVAKRNTEIQRKIIDAAVDSTSDISLTDERRLAWQIALEAVAIIAHRKGELMVSAAAQHNAALLASGKRGADVPFVRNWVEQQLVGAVAMARMVGKATALHDG